MITRRGYLSSCDDPPRHASADALLRMLVGREGSSLSGQPASGSDLSIDWVVRHREGLLAEGEERQPRYAQLEGEYAPAAGVGDEERAPVAVGEAI